MTVSSQLRSGLRAKQETTGLAPAAQPQHKQRPVALEVAPQANPATLPASSWNADRRSMRRALVAVDIVLPFIVTTGLVTLVRGTFASSTLYLAIVVALVWPAITQLVGGYRRLGQGASAGLIRPYVSAAVLTILAVAAVGGIVALSPWISRGTLVAVLATVPLGFVVRALFGHGIQKSRKKGRLQARAIFVTTARDVNPLLERYRDPATSGLSIIGVCADGLIHAPHHAPLLGKVTNAAYLARVHDVDVVVVDSGSLKGVPLRQLSWELERAGMELIIAPGVSGVFARRISSWAADDAGLLKIQLQPSVVQQQIKATAGRFGAGVLLTLCAPLLVFLCMLIRVESSGPAIYQQTRIGRDGVPFTVYKLRSMSTDADKRRKDLLNQDEGAGHMFKMKRDPRITRVGKWLRRTSLDELPQLINVVKGEMALVGPRPALPSEVAQYSELECRRLAMRPGMTGLWQVSGRSDLPWPEPVKLDLLYVDNWSLGLDIRILWKTIYAVVGGKGAY